jgi:hypothetical protein
MGRVPIPALAAGVIAIAIGTAPPTRAGQQAPQPLASAPSPQSAPSPGQAAPSPGQSARSPGQVDTLESVGGLAPDVAGRFREPLAFQRLASGAYLVFDRRGHAVYLVDAGGRASTRLVQIGAEDGRLIGPRAFAARPDGTFVVADAPNGRERVQVFDDKGVRLSGFTLPGRAAARVTFSGLSLSGVGTLAFTGTSLLISLPETGALFTEYSLTGVPLRSIGRLRPTGHEDDRDLHLALNAGIPIVNPHGGYYFVFLAGRPLLRRYDAGGDLVFERVIQGRELDPVLAAMPDVWPRRPVDGTTIPLVVPIVRTAAADPAGRLWVSFTIPLTYVFDESGEKIRTVQFRAAGIVSPTSLFFPPGGGVLVTPGCYAFETGTGPG